MYLINVVSTLHFLNLQHCKILFSYTFSEQKLLHYIFFTELQLAAVTENYSTF